MASPWLVACGLNTQKCQHEQPPLSLKGRRGALCFLSPLSTAKSWEPEAAGQGLQRKNRSPGAQPCRLTLCSLSLVFSCSMRDK